MSGLTEQDAQSAGIEQLAEAIDRLRFHDAVPLPFLAEPERRELLGHTKQLFYRTARRCVGPPERRVHQELEACSDFAQESPFRDFARTLAGEVNEALAFLDPSPLGSPIDFADIVVQRYPPGSLGITPHRDHIRYRGLVAIVVLGGDGRFFTCADRAGHDRHEISAPPGHVILLRAPGFAGGRDRPFHGLCDVASRRTSVGLRQERNTALPDYHATP